MSNTLIDDLFAPYVDALGNYNIRYSEYFAASRAAEDILRKVENRQRAEQSKFISQIADLENVKQSGTASEARQQMIDRHAQPENGETADNANRSDAADARQRKKKYAAARNSVYKPKYRYIKKK